MHIIPLSEGRFTVDATKKFIPFADTDELGERSKGSLLVEIQPFVIITKKDILLLDTGLGFTDRHGNLQLHTNLISAGINPVDVTLILMSHLHKDHAGGLTKQDPFSSSRNICFPNAKYVINKNEWNAALQEGSSYIPNNILPLKDSEQLLLTEGNGYVHDYIRFEHTGGHSPWHQAFWIEENDEIIFFGGDVAPQLVQLKTKFIAKYDYDGKKAAALRAEWWERGNRENWQFLFYHDIKTPIYNAKK
ncbi:MAG: MBL fold metallo-hydrolase [Bacteroidota bacterium]|jgi:glyoxylase-like metal-dependent hydrolase (beta-lactamase superfamily II)